MPSEVLPLTRRTYERSTIFVQQQRNGVDHWLPDLPPEVRTLLTSTSK